MVTIYTTIIFSNKIKLFTNEVFVCSKWLYQYRVIKFVNIINQLVFVMEISVLIVRQELNLLTPNDHYSGRTAPLTSKRCILYIYSTNTGTEYFKHDIYSPFLSLQNAVCFIILMYSVPVLFTFYIQGVLKFKKIIPAPKG